MKKTMNTTAGRAGFTLVELLVVISILAVLMGLLIPAVFGLLSKGPQLATFNELSNLDLAVQNFCRDYNVKFIPSKIMLCEKYADYNPAALNTPGSLEAFSASYLVSLWPQIAKANGRWKTVGIDWNGDGKADGPVILEGDQCLVYFLGGIPVGGLTAGISGFAIDQLNPASSTGGRKGPHFEFRSDRLRPRITPTCPPGSNYLSYYDPHSTGDDNRDKPYAYFSSFGKRNGFADDCQTINTYTRLGQPIVMVDQPQPQKLIPIAENVAPNRFHNPDGFQIISAGADRFFGTSALPNSIWTPAYAEQAAIGDPVFGKSYLRDDQANFYRQLMGYGQ